MTADKTPATLATAKHGGCVQLGGGLPEAVAKALAIVNEVANNARHAGDYKVANALVTARVALSKQLLALAAQPSPGSQGDALLREVSAQLESLDCGACIGSDAPMEDLHGRIAAHLAARQPVGEPLWCMHILGPDDVHAAPSKAHAEKAAAALNAFHAARAGQSEHDPKVEAVVAPWPHSVESHAESVADFIPQWLLPRWQVEAIQTNAARPAQAVDLGRWSQRHAEDLEQAIHTALNAHAGSLSQKKRAAISDHVKRLLVDSQAVGNG